MAYYTVVYDNPFFKRGAIVEDDADGFLQEVYQTPTKSLAGYVGIMVPLKEARPYLIKIQRRGLDKYKGGALR